MIQPEDYRKLNASQRKILRRRYELAQNGKCSYCGESLGVRPQWKKSINRRLFPNGFFNHPVHLHHNHKTGMTIGAVHAYCNAVLWQYEGE